MFAYYLLTDLLVTQRTHVEALPDPNPYPDPDPDPDPNPDPNPNSNPNPDPSPNPNPNPDPDPNPVPNQWKHERDERTRRASTDEARERVQNSDEAETAAAESAELGAPPSVAIAGGARELF